MESGFLNIDVKRFFQGKGQGRDPMVERDGFHEESRFSKNRKNVGMVAWDYGFPFTGEGVLRMKIRGLNMRGVIFSGFDGQWISINQIPGIPAKFALNIFNKARWTMQSKMFATTQGYTNEPIKPDKVIHMRMRNENILRP